MRSFWYEFLGDRIEIIFSLISNGEWYYHHQTKEKLGVQFNYPELPEHDNEIRISLADLEELDPEVRSMLFQKLQMDAPEFGLSFT